MSEEREIYNKGLNFFEESIVLPEFESRNDYCIFFRGLFDSYGGINCKTYLNNDLQCEILTYLDITKDVKNIILKLISLIEEKCITSVICNKETMHIANKIVIDIYNYNALDFLDSIYKNSDARFRNVENYKRYIEWCTFGLTLNQVPICSFYKADKDAIVPFKKRASDVGMDLTIIKLSKKLGDKTFMYDTGIIVSPEFGFYTKIIPRSSLVKSGYILSNSVGIIDGTYLGTLKIVLTKVDDSFPDLTLPFCCVQLIMDRHIHFNMEEVKHIDMLGLSTRGEGGVGSTSGRIDN